MSSIQRLPAEWEVGRYILLAWPHSDTDWAYMLDQVTACYIDIIKAIAPEVDVLLVVPPKEMRKLIELLHNELGDLADSVNVIPVNTNDTWTRDYGPITTLDDQGRATLHDFKFNGWGLKFAADKDNLVTGHLYGGSEDYDNCLNFVLEGGSIESDGRGSLMTTTRCLMSPNRNGGSSQQEIERYLLKKLGVDQVLWVDHGFLSGDDTDSHIDTLARFAPDGVILYVECDDPDDLHFNELQLMRRDLEALRDVDGNPYKLMALPWPKAIYDPDNGERLPATYANFLATERVVFVPTYQQPDTDARALEVIAQAFPKHRIVGIDCTALIRQHGSLHCATMQVPF